MANVLRTLVSGNARDVAFSPDQKLVYTTRSDGYIDVFDVTDGSRLASWRIGDALGAVSVSTDGRYLLASDPRQPLVYRVDTTSGKVTQAYVGSGGAYVDIEIVDAQTAIASGSSPAKINLNTGTLSSLSGSAYYSGNSILTEDSHLTLFGETGISNGPLHIYDDRTGTIVANGDSYQSSNSGFNYGVQAISEAANQVLQFIYYSSINVYDLSLKYQRTINLGQNISGLAYDPSGAYVYALFGGEGSSGGSVVKYDTKFFNTVETYAIPAQSSTNSSTTRYGNNLLVSSDGNFLVISDPGSAVTRLLDLTAVSLEGTSGDDALTGGRGADILAGGAGNDRLTGGLGNDQLDGGAGYDTAIIAGLYRQSSISVGATTAVVVGPDGRDTVAAVERLEFADGAHIFDVASAGAQVQRLFAAVLGRAPDDNGLDFYLDRIEDRGGTLLGVANDLVGSAEFQARTGGLTNAQFVDYIYQQTLGRAADQSGKAYYTSQLDQGMSRGALVVDFSESSEHKSLTTAIVSKGYFNTDDTYQSIALLYDGFAGRLPDIGGLTYYAGKVKSGAMTLNQVANDFAASAEFKAAIAGKTNAQIVDYIYLNTLDRAAEPGGRTYYTNQLDQGATAAGVLLDVALSQEHYNLYAAHITHGIDAL